MKDGENHVSVLVPSSDTEPGRTEHHANADPLAGILQLVAIPDVLDLLV